VAQHKKSSSTDYNILEWDFSPFLLSFVNLLFTYFHVNAMNLTEFSKIIFISLDVYMYIKELHLLIHLE